MKHPEELKTKFLELRARDVSYSRIAEELRVSKPTLIQWGKSMREEIADLQAAERELVREKLLGNFEQWLGRQVHHFNRLDAEFARREFKYSPTESVFRMMMASRKLLDRYFFEDDRPSRRRVSEGRAPSSTATAAEAIPLPRAAETQSLGRSTGSELGTGEGQTGNPASVSGVAETESLAACATGQDEGDSRSLSVAAPQFSADDALETGAYSENPAKTLPFPGQNSGVHNQALLSAPTAEVGRAVPSAPHALAISAAESKIENPNSRLAEPPAPEIVKLSEEEIDFGGESLPVNPFESTREWLERHGIQVSKVPEGARIITSG